MLSVCVCRAHTQSAAGHPASSAPSLPSQHTDTHHHSDCAGPTTVVCVCVCAELTPSQLRATLPAQHPLFRHSNHLHSPAGVTAAPPDTPLTPPQQTSTHPIDIGCQLGDATSKATSAGTISGALTPSVAADKIPAARGEASVKAGSAISMVKRLLRSSGPVQEAPKPADALRKRERCEDGEAGPSSVLPDEDMAQADDGEAGFSTPGKAGSSQQGQQGGSVLPCPDNGDCGEQPGAVGVPAGDDRLVCVQMLCVCKTQGVLTEQTSKCAVI